MDERRRQDWLQEITGADGARGVSRAIGRHHSTVQRWIRDGIPAEVVLELSVRFEADALEALVAVGAVTSRNADLIIEHSTLRRIPTERLVRELAARSVAATDRGDRWV